MLSASLRQETNLESMDSIWSVSAPSSPAALSPDAGSMGKTLERCKARAKQEQMGTRLARLRGDLTSLLRNAEEALLYTRAKKQAAAIEIETAYLRKVNDELGQIAEALSPGLDRSSVLDTNDAMQKLDVAQSVDDGEEFQYAHSSHFISGSPVSMLPEGVVDTLAWDRIDASCEIGSGARLSVPATWAAPSSCAEPFQARQTQRPAQEVPKKKLTHVSWCDRISNDNRCSVMTLPESDQTQPDPNNASGLHPSNAQFPFSEQFVQNTHRSESFAGRSSRRSTAVSEWWCNLDDDSGDDHTNGQAKLFHERPHGNRAQSDELFPRGTVWGDREMNSLFSNAEQRTAAACLPQVTNDGGPAKRNDGSIPSVANTYIRALLNQVSDREMQPGEQQSASVLPSPAHHMVDRQERLYTRLAKLANAVFAEVDKLDDAMTLDAKEASTREYRKTQELLLTLVAQGDFMDGPFSPGDAPRQIAARTAFEPHPEPQSVRKKIGIAPASCKLAAGMYLTALLGPAASAIRQPPDKGKVTPGFLRSLTDSAFDGSGQPSSPGRQAFEDQLSLGEAAVRPLIGAGRAAGSSSIAHEPETQQLELARSLLCEASEARLLAVAQIVAAESAALGTSPHCAALLESLAGPADRQSSPRRPGAAEVAAQYLRTLFRGLLGQNAASSPQFASSPIAAGPEKTRSDPSRTVGFSHSLPQPKSSGSIAGDTGLEQRLIELENMLKSVAHASPLKSAIHSPAVTNVPFTAVGAELANKPKTVEFFRSSHVHRGQPGRSRDESLSGFETYRTSGGANVDEAQFKRLSLIEAALSASAHGARKRLQTEPARAYFGSQCSAATVDTVNIGDTRAVKTDIVQASLGTVGLPAAPGAAEMAVPVRTVSGYHLDLAMASSSAGPALRASSSSSSGGRSESVEQRFQHVGTGRRGTIAENLHARVSQS